jgi:hypothetical protein
MAAKTGSGSAGVAIAGAATPASVAAIAARRVILLDGEAALDMGYSMFGVKAGHVFAHVVGSLIG